ncbi:DUF222 domain-containing protein [Gordonia sp. TBRC 11910]|uniref:DUF222 domain-containing protein n=1 Tax=Gordonia asplenii TaxID=2725283 RepID=A0A848KTN9_9ACTN|nr:DUF222 domain-containing protein [Gordonia asplenii]NMO02066.1 DUF222 domain-containing protein [Gordonia asplenii]
MAVLAHDSPSVWPTLDLASLRLDPVLADPGLAVGDLLGLYGHADKGDAFLAWYRLRVLAELHTRLVVPVEYDDYRADDAYLQLGQRVGMTRGQSADTLMSRIGDAVAARDRLPATVLCLRDGLVTESQFHKMVAWTDLADGQPYMAELDTEIAAMIRGGRGIPYSMDQLRHRVDRLIFRKDPDAVRARRDVAKDQRGMFTQPGSDGMATIGATMTAEDVRIAAAHVKALANAVCKNDPRSFAARTSDAMYALLTQTPFECLCDAATSCTSVIPDLADAPFPVHVDPKVVVHVVANHSTMCGDDDEPGWVDGYGTVSADHVRDMAARPDATVRPVNPDPSPQAPAQPADPYRPTRLLDTYLRIRDGHSVVPGSHTAAWDCDLDHVDEYSFTDPASGGQTHPDGMDAKNRYFHNLKTHGDWLDDLDIDDDGRAHPVFYTPEGDEIRGHPGLGIDLFPGLTTIRFQEPAHRPATTAAPETPADMEEPQRKKTRLEYKHRRRRAERARNKKRRRQRNDADGDPPF